MLVQIAIFFTKAGAFVFGSGLAIVPFLYSGVVKEYGWLNDQEFLDAVAVAMITPGPVVITVGFIGYLVTARGADFWTGLAGASWRRSRRFFPVTCSRSFPLPISRSMANDRGLWRSSTASRRRPWVRSPALRGARSADDF